MSPLVYFFLKVILPVFSFITALAFLREFFPSLVLKL